MVNPLEAGLWRQNQFHTFPDGNGPEGLELLPVRRFEVYLQHLNFRFCLISTFFSFWSLYIHSGCDVLVYASGHILSIHLGDRRNIMDDEHGIGEHRTLERFCCLFMATIHFVIPRHTSSQDLFVHSSTIVQKFLIAERSVAHEITSRMTNEPSRRCSQTKNSKCCCNSWTNAGGNMGKT